MKNSDELALLETLDMGKPIATARPRRHPGLGQHRAGMREAIDKIYDEVAPTPGGASPDPARAGRRRRRRGAVEFPAADGLLEDRPGARRRQFRDPEARRAVAADGHPHRRAGGRGRHSRGRVQCACRASARPRARRSAATWMSTCVAFTGSAEVGKYFLRYAGESNMKRVSLECGGKTPNIIMADAPDLEAAAPAAAWGIFFNQGEVCNAGSRLIVEEGIKDQVLEKIMAVGKKLQPGDPLDPKTQMGAMVDKTQMERVLGYIETGKKEGAKLAWAASGPASTTRRLLRRAHSLRPGRQQDEDRPGGDLRARALDHHVQDAEEAVRSATTRSTASPPRSGPATSPRPSRWRGAPCRRGVGQLLRQRRHHLAVRRLQAVGLRPRQVAPRLRQVHRAEGDLDPARLGRRHLVICLQLLGCWGAAGRS